MHDHDAAILQKNARELLSNGLEKTIANRYKMKLKNKKVLSKDELKVWVKTHQPKLLVMAGAGDIDALVLQVKESLT